MYPSLKNVLLLLSLLISNNNNAFFFVFQVDAAVVQFELIHRHAPQLSNHSAKTLGPPNNTRERIEQLLHSDDARQQMLSHRLGLAQPQRRKAFEFVSNSLIEIPIRSAADTGSGQYFVSFRVGSPPQRFVLIADTGSDVTWVNCNYTCHACPKGTGRIFHAHRSRSFNTIPCSSHVCKVDLVESFSLSHCPTPSTPCAYDYRYADGSKVLGFFANETVSVGLQNRQKLKLRNVMIGCSEWSQGSFHDIDGVMGLGYNKHSFATKAAKQFGNKFSYCLVDHLSPSNLANYLSFGGVPDSTLPNMRYTELILGVIVPFYAVNVSGISIGGVMLNIPSEVWDVGGAGGVIMDSGSSLTFLAEPAYIPVMAALKAPLMKFKKSDLNLGPLEYCFDAKGFEESLVPKLVFHFSDGARFVPPVKSYVIDADEGVKCLGFASTEWPGTSVIGNIMQQNHMWEFDLGNNKLGFAPSTCTMFKSKT